MRVSTRAYHNDVRNTLARAEQDMRRLSRQLSSGRRLTRPSDDPVAVGAIINARADLSRVLNQQNVFQRAERLVGPADSALGNIASALRSVRDVVLGATQPGLTEGARASQAELVRSHREQILSAANTSIMGEYLFAGRLSRTQPFDDSAGAVTYTGDSSGLQLWVAPDRPMEVSIPGDRLFNFDDALGQRAVAGVDSDLFALLDEIADAIEAGDEAACVALAEDLDALYDHVVQQRGVLGARTQRIQDAAQSALNAEIAAREILSDVEDVDLAQTLIELQHRQTAYQAALAATSQLARIPTLFEIGW